MLWGTCLMLVGLGFKEKKLHLRYLSCRALIWMDWWCFEGTAKGCVFLAVNAGQALFSGNEE